MKKESLPNYINSPTDVADYMIKAQGLVQILEYIGGAESVIDKNAMAHTFRVIEDLIQEARDMLYALDDKTKEPVTQKAVAQA